MAHEAAPRHLIAESGGRLLAVAAEAVDGVVECPPVTPLPMVPAHVDGMAAVRGTIVLSVDLAAWTGAAPQPVMPGQSLILLRTEDGLRLGLRVCRVVGLAAFDAEAPQWNGQPVAAINLEGLDLGEMAAADTRASVGEQQPAIAPENPCVSLLAVRAGGRDLLLPVAMLQEVAPLDKVFPLPRAPESMLGVAYWRGHLLAALSLAALTNQPATEPQALIVARGTGDSSFALAVDAVLGLRRFTLEQRLRAEDGQLFAEAFRTDDGAVLALLDRNGLERRLAPLQQAFPELFRGHDSDAVHTPVRRLLTFTVEGQVFGVEVGKARRVIPWKPAETVPGGDAKVAGLIHALGDATPVLDLGRSLALPRSDHAPRVWLVVEGAGGPWALAAEAIPTLAAVPISDIDPVADRGMVAAVFKWGDTLGWLLSPDGCDDVAAA